MKILVALAALLLAAPASAALWSHGCVVTNAACQLVNDPYDCCTGAGTGNCPSDSLFTPAATTVFGGGSQDKLTIRSLERACWWFLPGDLVIDSPTFRATGQFRACLNEDILQAEPTTVDVDVIRCPDGGRPGTTPLDLCNQIETVVDNACGTDIAGDELIFEPGVYFFDIQAACEAGDICQMSIEGIDPQRQ